MATLQRSTDAELLLRLRSREREAWEELYALHAPRLRSFAYRLGQLTIDLIRSWRFG